MPHDHSDECKDDVPQEGHADLIDVWPNGMRQMVGKCRENAGRVAAHRACRTRRAVLDARLFPNPLQHARCMVYMAAHVGQQHLVPSIAYVPANERILRVVLAFFLLKGLHADRAHAPIMGIATEEKRHVGLGVWVV